MSNILLHVCGSKFLSFNKKYFLEWCRPLDPEQEIEFFLQKANTQRLLANTQRHQTNMRTPKANTQKHQTNTQASLSNKQRPLHNTQEPL